MKEVIFFGLEDTLVPGSIDPDVDLEEVKLILDKLETERWSQAVILTGLREEDAWAKIEKHGLTDHGLIKKEDVFAVNQKYIDSKAEEDRERYLEQVEKDPGFKDEYFKQVMINRYSQEKGIPKGDMVLVGHDLWFDGFYTMRFSQIDFALIKSANSERGEKSDKFVEGLIYIERNWPEINDLVKRMKGQPDLTQLNKYIFDYLKQQMLDPKTMKVMGKPLPGLEKLHEDKPAD
jgi:hypothetical protein